MKFPVEVTVKGHCYKIEYVNSSREVAENFEGDDWLGICGPGIIRVLATQSPFAILDTLIHELLHTVLQRNKVLKVAVKDGLEEFFVDALATELALVLLNNGWIQISKDGPPITKRIL